MKNIFTLRTLILLSFLLFCLPFLRTCSNSSIESLNPVMSEVLPQNSISKASNGKLLQKTLDDRKENIEVSKENFTYSFYGLLDLGFVNKDTKLDSSVFSDQSFYALLSLLLILISTICMLVFSFFKRVQLIEILGILNIFFLIISMILFYISDILKDLEQIKIGFYLVLINTVLIIFSAFKIPKLTTSNV
ncbi:hypothetical protein NAL32_04665 [Chryseobacterium sp. Ch-15]|uniref:Uncharacterized protein n=1 Tax=Chryseobacterium muglaense TaxID=2893752 RepID=A0A9Q3YPD0_9FLAO|nr:hypothetical protein [Chryseobacterium muglaense]MBD3904033.1 hypothetical protein [Chryseobacterium muglaense]MCC9032781.1 hypothetical protein [Chryseobacterium muglaense]MCM2553682.1 hypothetical protein [Chryseobacterium muglaense]